MRYSNNKPSCSIGKGIKLSGARYSPRLIKVLKTLEIPYYLVSCGGRPAEIIGKTDSATYPIDVIYHHPYFTSGPRPKSMRCRLTLEGKHHIEMDSRLDLYVIYGYVSRTMLQKMLPKIIRETSLTLFKREIGTFLKKNVQLARAYLAYLIWVHFKGDLSNIPLKADNHVV